MINFGAVPSGAVLPVFFGTYDSSDGSSITMTGLAVTDIEIYKGISTTQRASDAGYTLMDTDGIDVDSTTGIHAFSIDTGDNTDAGFYTVGSFFTVVVSAITVDALTVNFVAASFRIVAAEGTAGTPVADATRWNNLATVALPLIPTVAGRTLDVSAGGEAGVDWANVGSPTTAVNLSATNIDVDQVVASVSGAVGSVTGAVGSVTGAVGSVTGAVGSVTGAVGSVAAGGITASSIAADAIGASELAADAVTEIAGAVWDQLKADHTIADSFGDYLDDEITSRAAPGAAMDIVADGVDAASLAADAVDEIWDDVIEGAVTGRQMMRGFASAMMGKASGLATATAVYRDVGDTKDRITATVDADGNRTAVTRDLT